MTTSISILIGAAEQGDFVAAEQLFAMLYSELHRMAKRQLSRSIPVTLGATTLLHQTYLDMAARGGPSFPDQPRFMAYAARVMRGLIIDHARNRRAQKRGGQFHITSFPVDGAEKNAMDDGALVKLGEALDALAKIDPELAEVVDLKFFCGFSFTEIAAMRQLSERTIQRRWEKARIYLHRSVRADLNA